MINLLRHPLLTIAILLGVLLAAGTAGYILIEQWPFIDALYMTVITVTTIGYGEVKPLSPAGRIFTMGLVVVGVFTASYAATNLVEFIVSDEFQQQLQQRRRRKKLDSIRDHCIICGFGRTGRSVANELKTRRAPYIIIDQDSAVIERCHQLNLPAVQGNAADERILSQAGIERAKSLVAVATSDAENVFIILTATSLNPNLEIIARSNSEASIPKLEKAGARTVISPYALAGRRMAQMLTHPQVTRFVDGILNFNDQEMRLEEFVIGPTSPLAGLTLREARLPVTVLAVSQPDQELLSHPNADTRLLPGGAIIVMGIEEELGRLAGIIKG